MVMHHFSCVGAELIPLKAAKNAKPTPKGYTNLLVGADLVFPINLESLIHIVGKQLFFRVNGSQNQVISFQLREQDRFHLKDRSREI